MLQGEMEVRATEVGVGGNRWNGGSLGNQGGYTNIQTATTVRCILFVAYTLLVNKKVTRVFVCLILKRSYQAIWEA